jgi:hypothetical protein
MRWRKKKEIEIQFENFPFSKLRGEEDD